MGYLEGFFSNLLMFFELFLMYSDMDMSKYQSLYFKKVPF